MALERRKQFDKQPNEKFAVEISYTNNLPLGAKNIVGATLSAIKWPRKFPNQKTNGDDILQTLTGIPIQDPNGCFSNIRILLHNGIVDYDYKITILTQFDNNVFLEEELYARVEDE